MYGGSVSKRSAFSPPISLLMISGSVLSPQINRWSPNCQRSPFWQTGSTSSGRSSSMISGSGSSSGSSQSMSKPLMSSSFSSSDNKSMSHSDSFSLLSKRRNCLTSSSVRFSILTTGTSLICRSLDAKRRQWPIIKTLSLSTTRGCANPKRFIDSATFSICVRLCFLAFFS